MEKLRRDYPCRIKERESFLMTKEILPLNNKMSNKFLHCVLNYTELCYT